MTDTLSCGCPSAGKPCPHTIPPGKKRGGAAALKAERDALRAALAEVLDAPALDYHCGDTTVASLLSASGGAMAPEVYERARVLLGRP